jgi:uncharacterized protein with HEPN domain
MRRDFRLYLDDILEAIHQIRTYLADQNEEAFTKDRKTPDAVIWNLEIIGEAAEKLPEQIQSQRLSDLAKSLNTEGTCVYNIKPIFLSWNRHAPS